MLDLPRLAAALGQPALRRLLDALHRRLELGRPLHGRLALSSASDLERAACDALLGRRPTAGRALSLDLDELAEALSRAGICNDLATAVVALTGPAPNKLDAAAEHRAAWETVWQEFRPEFTRRDSLATWLAELRQTGVLKRLSADDPERAKTLLDDLLRLIAVLPALAEPLPSLAARLFGDARALDPGTPRATSAVRLAARLGTMPFEDHAEGRRAAWAAVGVLCDELSTPAIVFRLPSSLDTPLGRLLRIAADAVEPLHLSLRLLLRYPLSDDPAFRNREVFACENPSVIALAAERLGAGCAPLICVNGQFAAPALVLLRQLRKAGARLRYHGDFDPNGLTIAQRVMAESGGEPWRYGVKDYLAAPKGVAFQGEPGPAPWSPALTEAMRTDRRAVHEEAVFDTLAADLAGAV